MKEYFNVGAGFLVIGTLLLAPIAESFSDQHQDGDHHYPPHVVSLSSANSSYTASTATVFIGDTAIHREYELVPDGGYGCTVVELLKRRA